MMRKMLSGMTLLCALSLCAADQALQFDAKNLEARHRAKIEQTPAGIVLVTDTPDWDSGLLIKPEGSGKFDFSNARYLAADVENLSTDRQTRLTMHISSGSRDKGSSSHVDLPLREVNVGLGLNPGEKRTMRIYLPHASLFSAPEGGKNFRRPLETSKINSIEFKMQWPFEAGRKELINCRISNIRLEGEPDTARRVKAEGYFPFIDVYGQYKHYEWPEKIHADTDLTRELARESAELDATPAPAAWDEFGGWAQGPKLQATGNFRVAKHQGKWYFVDPAGHLFWSFGIDVLRNHTDATNGAKSPQWFEGNSPEDGMYPFTHWNLQKKYGKSDYTADFYPMLAKRLRAWGVNTIGAWGAPDFMALEKTPYTLTLGEMIRDIPRLGKTRFYDVFSPEFAEKMGNLLRDRAAADSRVARSITDPMCIGYFIDNELPFGDIFKGVMTAGATQPAKVEFLKDVKTKYVEIAKLNAAWETNYADWDAAASAVDIPKGKELRADFRAFEGRFVTRYFETCRKGIKSAAPNRLYLGCRFVGFRQAGTTWEAAAKYCDVVSVNTYSHSVFNTNRGDFRDRPILIGEFHYGTYDRGMFSSSLCPVGDQKERGVAMTRFVQGALAHPNFVGAHYFQFRDQPLTGRYDGEGYQIGFVDVADTPYPEMTRAAREVGENMYTYRAAGKLVNEMK